jgi:secreted trypsin-like serine protease
MSVRPSLSVSLLLVLLALAVPGAAQAQTAQPRVVGGTTVPIESYPYQVRLLIRSGASTYTCGGSIRDATHVITAAHCVTFGSVVPAGNVTVRYGSANTSTQLSAAVSKVSVYTAYVNGDHSYDAALLELAAPLSGYGGGRANAIPIASAATLSSGTTAGSQAIATGWGATSEGGTTSPSLQAVSLKLEADAYCTATYGTSYVGARTVCAGGDGTAATGNPDTCQGDSGGPLALSSGGVYQLVGITSYGTGCGRQLTPAAYTETSNADIYALITGTAAPSRLSSTASSPATVSPAPVTTTPKTRPPADTVRPAVHKATVRCKNHVCALRISAGDTGGKVKKVTVSLSRRARVCRKGRCRTVTHKRTFAARRSGGSYVARVRLTPALYRLRVLATDSAGNTSSALTGHFRVKR